MNPYDNVKLFDYNAVNQRFQQGQRRHQERDTTNALMDYYGSQLGNDPSAQSLIPVLRANPELGGRLLGEHQQRQQRAQADQIQMVGRAAQWADTSEKWDQAIDQLAAEGIPGVERYKGQFSPALRATVMAKAGVGQERQGTAMQQNYEFLKQQNPQLADSYLKNQAEGAPLIASNGDGTFTIIPRSMAGGQQLGNPAPQEVTFTPVDGGPTQPASGNFPR